MDRFTQVQVGSKTTGDRSIVDADAGYTSAVCKLDDQGRLVAIRLDGGTRTEEGILAGYTKASGTTAASIQVIGFDGVTRTFSVPSGATTTVNSLVSNLNSSYEGDYVSLRVSNDSNAVCAGCGESHLLRQRRQYHHGDQFRHRQGHLL